MTGVGIDSIVTAPGERLRLIVCDDQGRTLAEDECPLDPFAAETKRAVGWLVERTAVARRDVWREVWERWIEHRRAA